MTNLNMIILLVLCCLGPSFSDIGKAMEKLVLSQKNSSKTDYESSFISNESENESSGHSTLCDLLLSCCWHSIKVRFFILSYFKCILVSLTYQRSDDCQTF